MSESGVYGFSLNDSLKFVKKVAVCNRFVVCLACLHGLWLTNYSISSPACLPQCRDTAIDRGWAQRLWAVNTSSIELTVPNGT